MNMPIQGKKLEQRRLQQKLLHVLRQCSLHSSAQSPEHADWPSTRQLADALGISIYKARHMLLEMANHNLVLVARQGKHHALHWYPVTPNPGSVLGYHFNRTP
ncbi:FaeA/PapI family transcriptional regulator [Serratia rubidaea]|uniref:FaeA-like protein n=1 Tax=Serratia rubidaea TaxID=61652 RepID=A0A3S4WH43_SERRU|nr:FaeA/PapI family transcriptional regulator [Serratia rubidaea]MBH1930451.1 hypothetical protein [Serratia rubidaea]MDC6117551.1 FaeA/PapI family transcriptional regulator [Serratia rubidaea]MEB7586069.1 FaeA/PapI family transcriptional regulator [Serratia rubidaea]VEI65625.1 Uncharacterised protein [Serratia rubidaea]